MNFNNFIFKNFKEIKQKLFNFFIVIFTTFITIILMWILIFMFIGIYVFLSNNKNYDIIIYLKPAFLILSGIFIYFCLFLSILYSKFLCSKFINFSFKFGFFKSENWDLIPGISTSGAQNIYQGLGLENEIMSGFSSVKINKKLFFFLFNSNTVSIFKSKKQNFVGFFPLFLVNDLNFFQKLKFSYFFLFRNLYGITTLVELYFYSINIYYMFPDFLKVLFKLQGFVFAQVDIYSSNFYYRFIPIKEYYFSSNLKAVFLFSYNSIDESPFRFVRNFPNKYPLISPFESQEQFDCVEISYPEIEGIKWDYTVPPHVLNIFQSSNKFVWKSILDFKTNNETQNLSDFEIVLAIYSSENWTDDISFIPAPKFFSYVSTPKKFSFFMLPYFLLSAIFVAFIFLKTFIAIYVIVLKKLFNLISINTHDLFFYFYAFIYLFPTIVGYLVSLYFITPQSSFVGNDKILDDEILSYCGPGSRSFSLEPSLQLANLGHKPLCVSQQSNFLPAIGIENSVKYSLTTHSQILHDAELFSTKYRPLNYLVLADNSVVLLMSKTHHVANYTQIPFFSNLMQEQCSLLHNFNVKGDNKSGIFSSWSGKYPHSCYGVTLTSWEHYSHLPKLESLLEQLEFSNFSSINSAKKSFIGHSSPELILSDSISNSVRISSEYEVLSLRETSEEFIEQACQKMRMNYPEFQKLLHSRSQEELSIMSQKLSEGRYHILKS